VAVPAARASRADIVIHEMAAFLADWAATTIDRDHIPQCGGSSRRAGERLHDFLVAHLC
jgi:hypothetical protein